MATLPVVFPGDSVASSHMNAIRSELVLLSNNNTLWPSNINANGHGIINLGALVGHVEGWSVTVGAANPQSAFLIREVNLVGSGDLSITHSPRLGFDWGGVYGAQLGLDPFGGGTIRTFNAAGTGFAGLGCGDLTVTGNSSCTGTVTVNGNVSAPNLFRSNASNLAHWTIGSNLVGTSFPTSAIEIRETNLVTTANLTDNCAPRITFHWSGVNAAQLGMSANGVIRTFDNPGTGYAGFATG